jgi:hypothetical protein
MINHAWIKKLSIALIAIALIFGISYFYSQPDQTTSAPQENDIALVAAINDCDEITERAAAHLKAVVEFQKLEIIGRKARVFKLCMGDHGYMENKRWLDYIKPIANKEAKAANISVDEALENRRRADMKVANKAPSYWIKREIK